MYDTILEPGYNWKQAASQEGVDYGAVQKAFMDQSYAIVANKAKVLFQDPFRLGFEIVHRNEKATKMVGIYAFRVNSKLLYAPVFFVNGEIKAADMLYRADTKRFVPLTEGWCTYLVRGSQESAGVLESRNRTRQPDAYMDRLAYPQRVKYASEQVFDDTEMEAARGNFVKAATNGSLWNEMLLHCADDTPLRKLLPLVIDEHGPEALEKLAGLLDDAPNATRHVAKNYTKEELEGVESWKTKSASEALGTITIITSPGLAKSASSRERVFDNGYDLVDTRPPGATNSVVEEISDETIHILKTPGKVRVMLQDASTKDALLLYSSRLGLHAVTDGPRNSWNVSADTLYFEKDETLMRTGYMQELFGEKSATEVSPATGISPDGLTVGQCYVMFQPATLDISELFYVEDLAEDGDCVVISLVGCYGSQSTLRYAPGREETAAGYISDETKFLPVKAEVRRSRHDESRIDSLEPEVTDVVLMTSSGLDQWMRTSGGLTNSKDVTVRTSNGITFDVEHSENGTIMKSARDLGWLEAHLKLAEDFEITTDKAGEILNKAVDRDVTYRVYDTVTKRAFMTRPAGMESWIQSFDPQVQAKLDAPQMQILSTHTPKRYEQQSHYGDTYQRVPAENPKEAEDVLPMADIMQRSPEELAQMSTTYGMPHIFDHGCVGQMSENNYSIVEQIRQYTPDLEAGVDRCFRILFLLRYRPADFEEIYGKDDLIRFEQDLADLAARSGENLLKMLRRFEPNQYSPQDN